jgi:hypothetical protein
MKSMIEAQGQRGEVAVIVQLMIVLIGAGGVASGVWLSQGIDLFLGVATMVAALGAAAYCSWRCARKARYVWAWIVGGLVAFGGFMVGPVWFERSLLAQVESIEADLARNGVPRGGFIADNGPIDIRGGVARRAASGRLDVHFGLPDGSVVVHPASEVALAAELSKRCTEQLPNGWYRRHRCSSQ